jgi:hypothetical protein
MAIYDLNGSDTDSATELPEAGPSKFPVATKVAGVALQRQNAIQLLNKRQISAEAHEIGSSASSSTRQTVELSEYGDNEPRRKRPKPILAEPERLQWSDDGSANNRGGERFSVI